MTINPLLILGMHRSGTSCLAGCLEAGGLVLGDVNTSAAHNARGNREHETIRAIHDRLLAVHGYSWDHPPPGQLRWRPADLEDLKSATEAFQKHSNWGFKDPRSIFCLTGWKDLFSPRLIATFRHPIAVSQSLIKRSQAWRTPMREQEALSLWVDYNTELLNVSDKSVPFIRYDTSPDIYREQIEALSGGLKLDAEAALQFYTPDLTHHVSADVAVPHSCANVWDQLIVRYAVTFS